MAIKFYTVDVFTKKRFEGAQIAVVPDATDLTEQQMLSIAEEFNLWRTVFITPSDKAKKKIRIFNGKREFEFGGHPTIAAIYTLAKTGELALKEGENQFTLEEVNGSVECMVKVENGEPVFNQFTTKAQPEFDRFTPSAEELGEMLSIESYHFNVNGFTPLLVATHMPYLVVPVDSFESLKAARFNYDAWARSAAPATCANAILLFSGKSAFSTSDFHCRLVGPVFGIHEDPPIGAAIPAFSGYLNQFPIYSELPAKYVAERGAHQGRRSYLHVDLVSNVEGELTVKIGGNAILSSEGQLFI
ncbi:PhzF family phenazine biosynthesis protein [Catenovulum sediminis]|uniref:PhzF family phenazine biosynthesis protein n=1 Tax=Catenovulum sediminis TaxID=1740262 RepID=A0ABV1RJ12_9ALTE